MSSFLQEAAESGMLPTAAGEDAPEEGDSQDDFVPGGSPVFPFGFGAARQSGDDKAKGKNGKKDKAPKRKFLDTYCENLTQKARDGKVTASSAATAKFTAPSRSCAAARRTTPA